MLAMGDKSSGRTANWTFYVTIRDLTSCSTAFGFVSEHRGTAHHLDEVCGVSAQRRARFRQPVYRADSAAALMVVEPPSPTGVGRDRVDIGSRGRDWHRPTSESERDDTGNDGDDRATGH